MKKIIFMFTGLVAALVLSFSAVTFAFGDNSAALNDAKMKNITIVNEAGDCCETGAACCTGGSCCHRKS